MVAHVNTCNCSTWEGRPEEQGFWVMLEYIVSLSLGETLSQKNSLHLCFGVTVWKKDRRVSEGSVLHLLLSLQALWRIPIVTSGSWFGNKEFW